MQHKLMGGDDQMEVGCIQIEQQGSKNGPLRNAEDHWMRGVQLTSIRDLLSSAGYE